MVIIKYALREIEHLLREAALSRSVLTYGALQDVFDRVESSGDRWDTLAEAEARLCHPSEAIYGALMSKKENGLPGDGFFRLFHDERSEEYQELVGDAELTKITDDQRRKIVDFERSRVYKHAARYV